MTAQRAIVVTLVLAAGCLDDFVPGSLIDETRVLGARVQVAGQAPEVASPRPGERIQVRWLVVAPEPLRPLESTFLTCPSASVRFGIEVCDGEPTLGAPCEAVSEPCLEANVPSREPPFSLLVIGGICAGGSPGFDVEEQTFRCEGGGAEGTAVTLEIPVIDPLEPRNLHPRFGTVLLAGELWPEAPRDLSGPSCPSGAELPEVERSLVPISVGVEPDSFEGYTGSDALPTEEEIQVSHFATAGELDSQFAFLRRGAPPPEVLWASPGEAGTLVRFYFVLRDGRGGQAWSQRALCVR